MTNNSIFDILNSRKAKKLSSKSSEFFQFAKLIRAGKLYIKDKTILDSFLYSLSSNPHNLSLKKDEKMISIKVYQIWDFGQNHMAEVRNEYPHDEFVSCNMNSAGYEIMQQALYNYFKKNTYDEKK